MKNNPNEIQLSLLQDENIETLLVDLFHPSKNKLKKHFDKKFLQRLVFAKKTVSLPIDFVNDGEINPHYDGPEIEIIYEDELFLVLNKPANLFVHPLIYSESNNCLSYLRSIGKKCLDVNIAEYDRGLLYRLDFETSGVLVYVKRQDEYKVLREQFNSLTKEKIYLAVVSGNCQQLGNVYSLLSATGVGGSKMKAMACAADLEDKMKAQLEILSATYNEKNNTTLLEIQLGQGHRHQIRVQLSSIGFPIVGDTLYGGGPAERLYLHAYKYLITYRNEDYKFLSNPSDFN